MNMYQLAGPGIVFTIISYLSSTFCALAITALELLGLWKIFVKMGEPGWKGIIPYYNMYVLFQKVWNVKKFWTYIISMCTAIIPYIIGIILTVIGAVFMAERNLSLRAGALVMLIIGVVFMLAAIGAVIFSLVVAFGAYKRLAHSFGKSTGFAWGLLLLSPIFLMILGFDKSQYVPLSNPNNYQQYQ